MSLAPATCVRDQLKWDQIVKIDREEQTITIFDPRPSGNLLRRNCPIQAELNKRVANPKVPFSVHLGGPSRLIAPTQNRERKIKKKNWNLNLKSKSLIYL